MPVLYGVFLYMGASSLRGIQVKSFFLFLPFIIFFVTVEWILLKPLPVQFFDRLKLFSMPAKHQPDFIYLRHVPLRKVHLFTIVQLSCLVLLWVIKTSKAAIVFPMMVTKVLSFTVLEFDYMHCQVVLFNRLLVWLTEVFPLYQVLALVFIRKLLDFIFTKRELSWLDDLMPEWKKKKLEDAQQEVP